jgi:tetratricopeptide (TPR) repeat protein
MTKQLTFILSLFGALFLFAACGNKTHDLESISGMNAALAENPSDTAARFARARYYQGKGKSDSALADMQVLVKADSLRPDYYLTMADIYLAVNQTRYTRMALQRAISLNSELEIAHMKLAELYLYVQMRQEALNELNEVLKFYQADKIVFGHSVMEDITKEFNGKTINTDVKHGQEKNSEKTKGLLIENGIEYKLDGKGTKTKL